MPDQADKRFAKRLGKEYETTGMKHNTVLYSSKTGLYSQKSPARHWSGRGTRPCLRFAAGTRSVS